MQPSVNPLISAGADALRPIQSAFFNNPDVSHYQDSKKHQHLDETEEGQLFVKDRPGKQENGLDIENNEQDRDNVIPNCITTSRIGIRIHTALVRHQLSRAAAVGADELGH